MYFDKETREEMAILSKEVFGSAGRWRKLLENGQNELVTKTVTEEVPGENGAEPTFKDVKMPVLEANNAKLFKMKYYTFETLKEYMLELKVKRDEILAMIKKQQEEQKAKKEAELKAEQFKSSLAGSAL